MKVPSWHTLRVSRILPVASILPLMCSFLVGAQQLPSPEEVAVQKLESRVSEAYVHRDVATLDSLLAPGYVSVNKEGLVRNKEQILEDVRSGVTEFESVTDVHKEFHVNGDIGIVVGTAHVSAKDRSGAYRGTFQIMRVWKREPDGWKVVAAQSFVR